MDEPPQVHEGEEVEIYTLADESGMIRNHSFLNCEFVGPAVLGTSQSIFRYNRTTNRIDYAVFDLRPTQVGVAGTLQYKVFAIRRELSGSTAGTSSFSRA